MRRHLAAMLVIGATSACGYEFVKPPPRVVDQARGTTDEPDELKNRTVLPKIGGTYIRNYQRLLGAVLYTVPVDPASDDCSKTKISETLTRNALAPKCEVTF